jgi:hypothetical protein
MKSFNNCKVAVCLSGQSRTYANCHESIKKYFSSNKGNQYYFFGHTWDSNTYKVRVDKNVLIKEEKLNVTELEHSLKQCFDFASLEVEHEIYRPHVWASMLYSIMKCNFQKQLYEAQNNMMFDLVIKCRYDLCFPPGKKFEDDFCLPIQEKTLYSNFGFMNNEFYLPNPDDVIYFGTSLTMDLIDSIYNATSTKKFQSLVGTNDDNQGYLRVGPGILLHKWATIKNILPKTVPINYFVYRMAHNEMNIDWQNNWTKALDIGRLVYK